MPKQDGDGKENGFYEVAYFNLPSGRIRVQKVRQGPRTFLEVIAVDDSIDIIPISPKTVLISTRSINVSNNPTSFGRVRRSGAPLLPGRKPDGG